MKTRMTTLSYMAGTARHLVDQQLSEMERAAEYTSAVKRYTPEEIAAYERNLAKKDK